MSDLENTTPAEPAQAANLYGPGSTQYELIQQRNQLEQQRTTLISSVDALLIQKTGLNIVVQQLIKELIQPPYNSIDLLKFAEDYLDKFGGDDAISEVAFIKKYNDLIAKEIAVNPALQQNAALGEQSETTLNPLSPQALLTETRKEILDCTQIVQDLERFLDSSKAQSMGESLESLRGHYQELQRVSQQIDVLEENFKQNQLLNDPQEAQQAAGAQQTPELEALLNSIKALSIDDPDLDNTLQDLVTEHTHLNADLVKQFIIDSDSLYNNFRNTFNQLRETFKESLNTLDIKRQERRLQREFAYRYGVDLQEGHKLLIGSHGATQQSYTISRVELDPDLIEEEYKVYSFQQQLQHIPLQITLESSTGTQIQVGTEVLKEKITSQELFEDVATLEELNAKLALTQYGQEIKANTKIEYTLSSESQQDPARKTYSNQVVTITQIHGNLVKLDAMVDIGHKDSVQKSELTLSEFLMWYRSKRAEIHMDISQAAEVLEKQPSVLHKRYPDTPPEIHSFSNDAIPIQPGVKVQSQDGVYFTIQDVTTDANGNTKVILEEGHEFSPSQFVRFCKDHELEYFDPNAPVTKNPKVKKDSAKDIAKRQEMNPFDYIPRLNFFFDPLDFLELQLVSFNHYEEIFTVIRDVAKNKADRKQKKAVSQIGVRLPGETGRKFADQLNSLNNEITQQAKDEVKSSTISEVKAKLYAEKDKYRAKGFMEVLAEKGRLDLYDEQLWKTTNRLLKTYSNDLDTSYKATQLLVSSRPNMAGKQEQAAMVLALDAIYGQEFGTQIESQQTGKFNSEMSMYVTQAHELNVGIGSFLHDKLIDYQAGKEVNPAEYLSYLNTAIENGYLSMEEAIYYIIAGFGTRQGKKGATLLKQSVVTTFKLEKFPPLIFFNKYHNDGRKLSQIAPQLMKSFGIKKNEREQDSKKRFNVQAVSDFIYSEFLFGDTDIAGKIDTSVAKRSFEKDWAPELYTAMTTSGMKELLGLEAGTSQPAYPALHVKLAMPGFSKALKTLAGLNSNKLSVINEFDTPIRKQTKAQRVKKVVQVLQNWFLLHSTMKGYYNLENKQYSWGHKFSEAELGDSKGGKQSMNQHFSEVMPFFKTVVSKYYTPLQVKAICGEKDEQGNFYQYGGSPQSHTDFMKSFVGDLAGKVGSDPEILSDLVRAFPPGASLTSGAPKRTGWKLFGGAKPSTPDKKDNQDTPQGGTGSSGALAA